MHQLSRGTSHGLDRLPETCGSSAKLFHALSRVQARKIGRHDEHINIAAIFGLTTGMGTKQNGLVNADAQRSELGAIAGYEVCNLGSWRTHRYNSFVRSR